MHISAVESTAQHPPQPKPKRRVVVTGMGCVTALGHEPQEFYNNLLEVTTIPHSPSAVVLGACRSMLILLYRAKAGSATLRDGMRQSTPHALQVYRNLMLHARALLQACYACFGHSPKLHLLPGPQSKHAIHAVTITGNLHCMSWPYFKPMASARARLHWNLLCVLALSCKGCKQHESQNLTCYCCCD